MTFLEVIVMAALQAAAEVLPLSASAHLALLGPFGVDPDQRLAVTLAADGGLLLGVTLYLGRDMLAMGIGVWRLIKGRPDAGTRLFFKILVGSIPAISIAWGLGHAGISVTGALIGAVVMAACGLALLIADKLGMTVRRVDHMSYGSALIIGAIQALAIVPGVSRTGIVLTVTRLVGYERDEAARLALLLLLPSVAVGAVTSAWELSHRVSLVWSQDLAITAGIAALAALAAAAAMTAWVRRRSYAPFAVWRILVGTGAAIWILWH